MERGSFRSLQPCSLEQGFRMKPLQVANAGLGILRLWPIPAWGASPRRETASALVGACLPGLGLASPRCRVPCHNHGRGTWKSGCPTDAKKWCPLGLLHGRSHLAQSAYVQKYVSDCTCRRGIGKRRSGTDRLTRQRQLTNMGSKSLNNTALRDVLDGLGPRWQKALSSMRVLARNRSCMTHVMLAGG
jgi:hypothetical protein